MSSHPQTIRSSCASPNLAPALPSIYNTHPDREEKVPRLTNGVGADYIIENGGICTIAHSLGCVAPGGVVSVICFLSQVSSREASRRGHAPDATISRGARDFDCVQAVVGGIGELCSDAGYSRGQTRSLSLQRRVSMRHMNMSRINSMLVKWSSSCKIYF